MSQNQQTRLILRAYQLLEEVTPLTTDCGELCGHRCCHGEDHDGMWLLPGEEQFFLGQPGFSVQPCQDNAGYPLVVCDGHCDRRLRPFACRIFPLFPMVRLSPLGGIMVQAQMDPRAQLSCPLREREQLRMLFRRRVQRAEEILVSDPQLRAYLLETTEFLEEVAALREKMLGQ